MSGTSCEPRSGHAGLFVHERIVGALAISDITQHRFPQASQVEVGWIAELDASQRTECLGCVFEEFGKVGHGVRSLEKKDMTGHLMICNFLILRFLFTVKLSCIHICTWGYWLCLEMAYL